MSNKLQCPFCNHDIELENEKNCPHCGLTLYRSSVESKSDQALDALRSAFSQISNPHSTAQEASDKTYNSFLQHHNEELMTQHKQCFHLHTNFEYKHPEGLWEQCLDLAAGGARIRANHYTSAMFIQGLPGSGKSELIYQLASHAISRDHGPHSWPASVPCIINDTCLQKNEKHPIGNLLASIFGQSVSRFSNPALIIDWMNKHILSNYPIDANFLLLLDISTSLLQDRSIIQELEELIAIASQKDSFKIIIVSDEFPEHCCKSCLPYLHHRVMQKIGDQEQEKPFVVSIPALTAKQILSSVPWVSQKPTRYSTMNIERLHQLLPSMAEDSGEPPFSQYSWSWKSLSRPWALQWYLLCVENKKNAGFPFKTPKTLINWGFTQLAIKNKNIRSSLASIISSAGNNITKATFLIPDHLNDQKNLLIQENIICPLSDTQYRFIFRPIAFNYAVSMDLSSTVINTFKWQLFDYLDQAEASEELIRSLQQLLPENFHFLSDAVIELCQDILEDGGNILPSHFLITLFRNTLQVNQQIQLFYALGKYFSTTHQLYTGMVWLNGVMRLYHLQKIRSLSAEQFSIFIGVFALIAQILFHSGSVSSAALWIKDGFEQYSNWSRSHADPIMATSHLRLLSIALEFYIHQRQKQLILSSIEQLLTLVSQDRISDSDKIHGYVTCAKAFEHLQSNQQALEMWMHVDQLLADKLSSHRGMIKYKLKASLGVARNKKSLSQSYDFESWKIAHTKIMSTYQSDLTPISSDLAEVMIEYVHLIETHQGQRGSRLESRINLANQLSIIPEFAPASIAIADNGVGLHLKNNDYITEAQAVFQHAIDVYHRYLREWPITPVHIKNISVFYYNLGFLFNRKGELQRAGCAYQTALNWRQKLINMAPESREYKHDFALGLNVIGVLSYNLNQLKQARYYYEQAIEILKELAQEKIDKDNSAKDLVVVIQNLALLEQETGALDRALEKYFEAVDSTRVYLNRAEEQADLLHRLAIAINSLGLRLSNIGKDKQALLACQMALEIVENLIINWPHRTQYTFGLSGIVSGLATVLHNQGKHRLAHEFEEHVIDLLTSMINTEPQDNDLRFALASVYLNIARTSKLRKNTDAMKTYLLLAQEILQQLVKQNPQQERYIRTLAECHTQMRKLGFLQYN